MAERVLRVPWWRCALIVGALVLIAAPVTGQTLTEQLLADARDGTLDGIEFFEATLIASGVEDEGELSGWRNEYGARRAKLLTAAAGRSQLERLRALHAALHQRLLMGEYKTEASDVRLALSRGDFNCLSSLAIYFDLCRVSGLDVQIW